MADCTFPPSIPGYVVCGIGRDKFMFMDIYDVALLLSACDMPEDTKGAVPSQVLAKCKSPIVLAIRLLRNTTLTELIAQISKSLVKRATPLASANALCNRIAASSASVSGKMSKGDMLQVEIEASQILIRRQSQEIVVADTDLAQGFRRTFWGSSPTVPSLVTDLQQRFSLAIAAAAKIRSATPKHSDLLEPAEESSAPKEITTPTQQRKVSKEPGYHVIVEQSPRMDASFTTADGYSKWEEKAPEEQSIEVEAHKAEITNATKVGDEEQPTMAATVGEALIDVSSQRDRSGKRLPKWLYMILVGVILYLVRLMRRRRPSTLQLR
mmetsp:Transcript_104371/g.162740  ORF Transcript_104371/g.162740 Transcript_104371/m.162740 type:complete len:325 (-) Transcript_104371:206-1180(-)